MPSCPTKPTSIQGVHKITGWIAALSRFISRLGEKAIPLYRLLKKTDTFIWDKDADEALEALKLQLSQAPILAAARPKETMLLYIATHRKTLSAAIVVE